MRNAILIAALALSATPLYAADAGPPADTEAAIAAEAAAPPVAPPAAAEIEPTTAELASAASDVAKAIGDWHKVGPLGLAIALLALLTKLTKHRLAKRLLEAKGLAWTRPIITAVLGGLGAAALGLQQGAGVGPSLVAGLLAGLGAVGLHEVSRLASKKERGRVRVDAEAVAKATEALKRATEEKALADGKAAGIKAELDAMAALPQGKRLEALAELLGRR